MESARAWLQDRKNLPIVAVGSGIIVIAVLLVFLRTTGTIGGGDTTTAADVGTSGYSQPYSEYPQAPGGVPGAAPQDPGMGMVGDDPHQMAAAPASQSPMLPHRRDPFQPFAGPPTRPQMLASIIPNVASRRLASPSRPVILDMPTEVAIPDVLPPQPFRRMVGVMYNGQVSAILETEGVSEIVRPGMRIPTTGQPTVLVDSIEADAIILKTLNTPRPMTIRVNMSGSVSPEEYYDDYSAVGGMPGSPMFTPGMPPPPGSRPINP